MYLEERVCCTLNLSALIKLMVKADAGYSLKEPHRVNAE